MRMTWTMLGRIALKTAALLLVCNLIFAMANGAALVEQVSLYNLIIPGRVRLSYGETPARSYSLTLDSIPAMLLSHSISRPKAADEYRVALIGDSSVWGWLLENEQTLASQLEAQLAASGDSFRIRVYNLGYPVQAALKDLLLLDEVLHHAPDHVLWFITLDGLTPDKQTFPPLVTRNAGRARALIAAHGLAIDLPALPEPDLAARSIIGMRRPLADWFRLQVYGIPWALTGVDQFIPPDQASVAVDLPADVTWNGITEPRALDDADLMWEVLAAGVTMAHERGAHVTVVNQPIQISDGVNADVRYNVWYPRWAFDSYRDAFARTCAAQEWLCADLWNAVPAGEFTDSPVHLSPAGTRLLADAAVPLISVNRTLPRKDGTP
jgi:hypothetical protein